MDTQWPRWEVFKQDHPDKPHEAIGTVHAPDAEMALLSARDVFVRRPACHSLWVAREAAVLRLTAQELAATPDWLAEQPDEAGDGEAYLVFCRQGRRRTMVAASSVGQVVAASPASAMRQAVRLHNAGDIVTWWVVPASAVTASEDADAASMFEPALSKSYRDQAAYRGRIFEGKRRGQSTEEAPEP